MFVQGIGEKRDGCEEPVVDGKVVASASMMVNKMGWEGFKNHYLLLMVSPNGVVVTKWYLLMGPKFGYHYHSIPSHPIKYHYTIPSQNHVPP